MIIYNEKSNEITDGKYHVHGKTYKVLVGKRAQVWHGTAFKTTGGLTKSHLHKIKHGRIVSMKKHKTAKKKKDLKKPVTNLRKEHLLLCVNH